MRIKTVRYSRLVSFGNYSNESVEAEADVSLADNPADVLDELKQWVCDRLNQRVDIQATIAAQQAAEWDLKRVEQDLAEARERWGEAKVILAAHGVSLGDKLPF